MDKKQCCGYTLATAKSQGEVGLWKESHALDISCAGTITGMLGAEGDVAENTARQAIDEYGHDRVSRVLANSIQRRKKASDFDSEVLKWARGFYIPREIYQRTDVRLDYAIQEVAPEQLSAVVRQARACYEALGLFEHTDCIQGQEMEGRVAVLRPSHLRDDLKRPEYQLVLATGGFGCSPSAGGRKVFGAFLKDGEQATFVCGDFMGVLKPELLPEWAKRSLVQMTMERNRHVPEPRYYAVATLADGESIGPVHLRDEQDALTCLNRLKDYLGRLDIRRTDGTCLVTVERGVVTYAAESVLRERFGEAGLLEQEQSGGMTPSM